MMGMPDAQEEQESSHSFCWGGPAPFGFVGGRAGRPHFLLEGASRLMTIASTAKYRIS